MKASLSASFLFAGLLYRLNRLIMPLDVQMIAHRLSVGSESMKDQTSRFSERQAISFYGIGVKIRLKPELFALPVPPPQQAMAVMRPTLLSGDQSLE